MIGLHYWPTPNGWKVTIMLEECGLPYKVFPVNILEGEQFKLDFRTTAYRRSSTHAPAGGGQPVSIFESGAILIYLAEKTGKFLPKDGPARYDVMQWLMWQMGGVGPMSGPANYFRNYAKDKIEYAINRHTDGAEPALRRPRQAAQGSRIHGRRVFDRRHGDLSGSSATPTSARRSTTSPA